MTMLPPLQPFAAVPRPDADPFWSQERLLSLHKAMARSRVLDRFVTGLQRRGLVSVFVPAQGHEAHIYGALIALRDTDWLFADVRQGAAALYRGLELRAWLAMLLGTRSAAHLGHPQSMELTSRATNFVSVSSPVGTQIIHASGTAQAMKARRVQDLSFVWFGPAAAASGDCHVGLNFAGVGKVPGVFYFCSSGDAAADAERLGGDRFVDRAPGYGIRGVRVDGSDVFAVHAAVAEAAAVARAGGGPTLIEGVTGGFHGGLDPLARLEAVMESRDLDGPGRRRAIDAAFHAELEGHLDDLLLEGPPDSDTLFEQVFATPGPRQIEQRAQLNHHRDRFAGGVVD